MAVKETAKTNLATEVVVNEDRLNEYVSVTAPRAQVRADQTLMVSVNGQVWNIPRGKPVTVPRYVAEKIEDMVRRTDAYEASIAETYNSQSVQYLTKLEA